MKQIIIILQKKWTKHKQGRNLSHVQFVKIPLSSKCSRSWKIPLLENSSLLYFVYVHALSLLPSTHDIKICTERINTVQHKTSQTVSHHNPHDPKNIIVKRLFWFFLIQNKKNCKTVSDAREKKQMYNYPQSKKRGVLGGGSTVAA